MSKVNKYYLCLLCRAGYHGVHDHPYDRDDEHRHQPHPLRLPQREFHQGVQVHFLHQFSGLFFIFSCCPDKEAPSLNFTLTFMTQPNMTHSFLYDICLTFALRYNSKNLHSFSFVSLEYFGWSQKGHFLNMGQIWLYCERTAPDLWYIWQQADMMLNRSPWICDMWRVSVS